MDYVTVDERRVLGIQSDVGSQVVGCNGQILQRYCERELPLVVSLDVGLRTLLGIGRPLAVCDRPGQKPPLKAADQRVRRKLIDLLICESGECPLVRIR